MDKTLHTLVYLMALAQVAAAAPPTYTTWAPWQVDSILAAWAIKRHVAPDAAFTSVARGVPIPPERAIDTPDSPYRRNARRTAFEEALRIHAVPESACIARLLPIVRVLELAAWRKAESPEAERFELELLRVAVPSAGGMEVAFAYIDRYCAGGVR